MILFIHTVNSPFVKTDLEILGRNFEVRSFQYLLAELGKSILAHGTRQFALLCFLIRNIRRTKHIYIWFADYHAFLPVLFSRIFRKKSLLVLGGYDVTYIPEIKYGVFSRPLRAFCAGFAIRHAAILLPVDKSLTDEAVLRLRRVNGRIIPLPTGYDGRTWYCDQDKRNLVLTVCTGNTDQRVKLKGIDLFIEVAAALPRYEFCVIGLSADFSRRLPAPANLRFVGPAAQADLRKYYAQARVYAQFSLKEGLPNAVCEAMLCECVPVGSKVNGIPAAIGDCGYLLDQRQVNSACDLIQQAMQISLISAEAGKKARARIEQHFSMPARERTLVSLLKNGMKTTS